MADDLLVRRMAMDCLARREYGYIELKEKLLSKYSEAIVDQVLCDLRQETLQSDRRYAQVFVKSGIQKGNGFIKLQLQLQKRGIQEECINIALSGVDWVEIAQEVRQKKYGEILPETTLEKIKQARYLQQKGHDEALIHELLKI